MDIFTVDAFTDVPFSGNPAAVCVIETGRAPLDQETMKKIAAEMNLSETAFVQSDSNTDVSTSSSFTLRWFTPLCEVNLCGHGTLATANVLFKYFKNPNTEICFSTLSGQLKAIRDLTSDSISLDFPLASPIKQDLAEYKDIIAGTVGSDLHVTDCLFSPKTRKLLIRLSDSVTRDQLESLTPNPQSLLAIKQDSVKGVIVTVKSTDDSWYDFLSRYFAPWVGIPEDPVTGSAHTVLGPYWSGVLDKKVLKARQCSSRGGELTVTVMEQRVMLTGKSCVVLKGKLIV